MYRVLIAFFLCIPYEALGHGSGSVVPAPVPVSMAVWAGIFAVVATWLLTLRGVLHYNTYHYKYPRFLLPMFLIVFFCVSVAAVATDMLPLFWWFGVMTVGVVVSSLVSFPIDIGRTSAHRVSLAPLLLFSLFAAEFFVPQSQTTQGLFFLITSYVLIVTIALMASGKKILRHELVTRVLVALGSAAPVRSSFEQPVPTTTDRWLILILVIATSFDGLLHSEYWRSWTAYWGIEATAALPALFFFAAAVVAFNVCYFIAIMLMRDDIRAVDEYSLTTLANHFVPAFVPIAIGYCVAHNITRVPQLFAPEYIVYTWGVQLACIIVGHVLSVCISHHRAQVLLGTASRVRRSQLSMTVFMVLITGVSIMMLQAPL